MDHLVIASFAFLNIFMILGAVDLFYFHIWKYRLHTRLESRFEHKLHMSLAFIMVPVSVLLYYQNSGGMALWAGLFFVAGAISIELVDVLSENNSRASLGGLSSEEYVLHVVLTILKVASFSLLFASKPAIAWSVESPMNLGSYGQMAEMLAMQTAVGSGLVGILHLLLLHPKIAQFNISSLGKALSCCAKPQP